MALSRELCSTSTYFGMTMAANVLRMTKVEISSISVNPIWPVQGFFNRADNLVSPKI
jgi:hypothetical protein